MSESTPFDGEHLPSPEASPEEVTAIYDALKRRAIEQGEMVPAETDSEPGPELTTPAFDLITELPAQQVRSIIGEPDEDVTEAILSWSESRIVKDRIIDPVATLTATGQKFEGETVSANVIYEYTFVEEEAAVATYTRKLTMPIGESYLTGDSVSDEAMGELLHQRMSELMRPAHRLSAEDAKKVRQLMMMG